LTRFANVAGRASIITKSEGREQAIDVERTSEGLFAADPQAVYERWREFLHWVEAGHHLATAEPFDFEEHQLGSPAPYPAQVFGIGLNYKAHAAETGMPLPESVAAFTKFPTCISGGFADVELPAETVDWEVELVVVIGARAHRVADWEAWSYVAGVAVGQDLSERVLQRSAGGQFCLGKSYKGFGPIGPYLVTPDELTEPDDLRLWCSINGETMQDGRTSDMVFSVSRLVEELSSVVTLLPGDVIFTGTPPGVGWPRQPPRFLVPGDVLESGIDGIGTVRNKMVAGS
jgi:2-keto-4-pentenoate hydratase/2-oxohepta-3-ene-1,7-dioic acid hydratase in catechol pathway